VLAAGCAVFGFGEALFLRAGLGNGPWTVLAQSLGVRAGMNVGWATALISVAVLVPWIPLRQRPGLGTFVSIAVISGALALGVDLIPTQVGLPLQLAITLAGIALIGLGSALYLTCGMGAGPRDGLMTALHTRYAWPVARVRLVLEVGALSLGWSFGGTVGLGSAIFALLIGPALAFFLGLIACLLGAERPEPSGAERGHVNGRRLPVHELLHQLAGDGGHAEALVAMSERKVRVLGTRGAIDHG
jgi:hypothetical protein